jgi:acyl-CoA thioester hydrolase
MNRDDFEPPANAFTHRFVVEARDIDDLGHASNISWVRWVQDAAAAHSESVGLGLEAYRELGVLWVVRRHELDYLGAAFEGQTIAARTWVHSLKGATSLRRTLLIRADDEHVLGRGVTTWVLITAATGKPTRVPKELLERYGFG